MAEVVDSKKGKYNCSDYREEMILLGLRRRLNHADISADERKEVIEEIEDIEKQMGL